MGEEPRGMSDLQAGQDTGTGGKNMLPYPHELMLYNKQAVAKCVDQPVQRAE